MWKRYIVKKHYNNTHLFKKLSIELVFRKYEFDTYIYIYKNITLVLTFWKVKLENDRQVFQPQVYLSIYIYKYIF